MLYKAPASKVLSRVNMHRLPELNPTLPFVGEGTALEIDLALSLCAVGKPFPVFCFLVVLFGLSVL